MGNSLLLHIFSLEDGRMSLLQPFRRVLSVSLQHYPVASTQCIVIVFLASVFSLS
jgi:hypothetical protein